MNEKTSRRIFDAGLHPVGYLCTATPPEIIMASGGYPFRLTGTGEQEEGADALAHPNLCGFCKSALSWVKNLPADHRLFVVAAASCDGCRRVKHIMEILDPVTGALSFDLPRTGSQNDIEYYAFQLRKLHADLAELFGTKVDIDALKEAIIAWRKARKAFRKVLGAVRNGLLPVEKAFEASDEYFSSMPDRFVDYADRMLETVSEPVRKNSGPKVILAGNLTKGAEVAQAIESAGAVVSGIDLCNVERVAFLDVPDDPDPYLALAKAIYERPLCPRFEPAMDWAKSLKERAGDLDAEAVILFSLKFCDNTLFSFASTRNYLEGEGLSILTLEGDYSEGLSGQLITRIEAFIEML